MRIFSASFILSFFLVFCCEKALNQTVMSFGVSGSIGTTINRIGFFVQPSFFYEKIGFNVRATYYCVYTGLGVQRQTNELQIQNSLIYGIGKSDSSKINDYDVYANYTHRENAIVYSYLLYFDKSQTSQPTGIIGFQTNKWRIFSENDLFSIKKQDKFRTAAIILTYKTSEYNISLKSVLWTGDSFDKNAVRVTNDSLYKARFGYKDLRNAKFGKLSHGILCLQFDKPINDINPQTLSVQAGIDAEQIRHVLQNKIIHDLFFVPEKIISYKNMHYPMLQKDGTPFLNRSGQFIRKPKPVFTLSLNESMFY